MRRKGVIEDDSVTRDAELADSEPALAALAAASVTGTLPAGPALRRRDPIKLRGDAELLHTKALCATDGGFSLHAATTAKAGDAAGREALCKYVLRPPIANEPRFPHHQVRRGARRGQQVESASRSPAAAVKATHGAQRRRLELHDGLRDVQLEGEGRPLEVPGVGQAAHPSLGIPPVA